LTELQEYPSLEKAGQEEKRSQLDINKTNRNKRQKTLNPESTKRVPATFLENLKYWFMQVIRKKRK
jgi:hypothetical protein